MHIAVDHAVDYVVGLVAPRVHLASVLGVAQLARHCPWSAVVAPVVSVLVAVVVAASVV